MHRGQVRRRVHAQLVGQHPAGVLVGGQRVRLPPGRLEGAHQLAAQPLPQRVGRGQLLKLGHEPGAAAQGQVGLDPVLDGAQPQLGQPGDRRGRERRVGHVGQRRPAPQAQRLGEQRRPGDVVAVRQRRPAPPGQLLERPGIHLAGVRRQPVARRAVLDRVAAQDPAQPGHQRLDRVRRVRRGVVRPQVVGQPLDRYRAPVPDRQPDQQAAQPGSAHRHGSPGVVADLERAQHPDPHVHLPAPDCLA